MVTELDERINLQLDRIASEVKRAMSIHPKFPTQHHAYAVILEEVDEFWELVKLNPNKLDEHEQRKRIHDMQKELLQIAAMCIRTTIDCNLM